MYIIELSNLRFPISVLQISSGVIKRHITASIFFLDFLLSIVYFDMTFYKAGYKYQRTNMHINENINEIASEPYIF